jgi:hypothetical protein
LQSPYVAETDVVHFLFDKGVKRSALAAVEVGSVGAPEGVADDNRCAVVLTDDRG